MRLTARPVLMSVLAAFAALAATAALVAPVAAHGHRAVGDYEFTVGFFVEPAFEAEKNGVDLRVADAGDEPVLGLEGTLEVEISLVEGDQALTLPLRAVFNQPGRYTADFVPTVAGAYSFRFIGNVEGLQVDETFTSETDSFSSVAPIADLQFPVQVAGGRELQAALSGAVDAAAEADEAAQAATTRANIALGVGALGLLVGAGGLAFGLRRQA
ncbi:MAG: hypothetical protein M0R73_06970 [Dehalococcoidia bacterium]|nr:hypothetical protein [Dehalococcoidia bacterium]